MVHSIELADSSLHDLARIDPPYLDMDIGETNDFEMKFSRSAWKKEMTFDHIIYVPGEEYGGIIQEIETDTAQDTITLRGYTWRGMLDKKIIEPPSGEDYRYANGDLNEVLRELVKLHFNSVFTVTTEETGISVSNFKIDRYCTLLYGMNKILESKNYRLQIRYLQGERGSPGRVELSAVPIKDYSGQIELSQDSRVDFIHNQKRNGVNHLICLGSGELAKRNVLHLYVQKNGKVSTTQYFKGIQEITEVYDFSSSENLKEDGIKHLQEIKSLDTFEMDIAKLDLNVAVGDLVGGRDYITGGYLAKPIGGKVLHIENATQSISYTLKGDEE